MMLIQSMFSHQYQLESDGLLTTQSRVLLADWLILVNSMEAILNINMQVSEV